MRDSSCTSCLRCSLHSRSTPCWRCMCRCSPSWCPSRHMRDSSCMSCLRCSLRQHSTPCWRSMCRRIPSASCQSTRMRDSSCTSCLRCSLRQHSTPCWRSMCRRIPSASCQSTRMRGSSCRSSLPCSRCPRSRPMSRYTSLRSRSTCTRSGKSRCMRRSRRCTCRRSFAARLAGQACTHAVPLQLTLPPVGFWHAVVHSVSPHVVKGVVAHARPVAVVVSGIATNRARATLADRRTVRIRGALLARRSTGVGVIVRRTGAAALVAPSCAGEGTRATAAGRGSRASRCGTRRARGAAGTRSCIRGANPAAIVRARRAPPHTAAASMQAPLQSFCVPRRFLRRRRPCRLPCLRDGCARRARSAASCRIRVLDTLPSRRCSSGSRCCR